MNKFAKENLPKIIVIVVIVAVIVLVYLFSSNKSSIGTSTSNESNQQEIVSQTKNDFFNKFNLYYYVNGDFLKNGEKTEKGGDKFTPSILYSDGALLSSYSDTFDKIGNSTNSISDAVDSSATQNYYSLFFEGNIYQSKNDGDSVLRDKDIIYYLKCLKVVYHNSSNGNRCTESAIYANNDEVDKADLLSDVEISVGIDNIEPLFINDGILYYSKTLGEETNYYSYDPSKKSVSLYKPNMFSDNYDNLLGILSNGDIIFGNSGGIFKNNLQSVIFNYTGTGSSLLPYIQGKTIGDNYYYFVDHNKDNSGGYDLLKNDLLVSKINSNTYGKIINPDEQDCHMDTYIAGYFTTMYCINSKGTIVRLDSDTKTVTSSSKGGIYSPDKGVVYEIDNNVVNFSPYWKNGNMDVSSVSFIFDDNGNVSYLVIDALSDNDGSRNIYLSKYLGGGEIGTPTVLVSGASLFGVVKK